MALPDVADTTATLRKAFSAAPIPEPLVCLVGDSQNESPLFALPPELRTRIYEYSLTKFHERSTCHLKQESSAMVNMEQVELVKPSKALLVTCRRIYTEAKDISAQAHRDFWRDNTFFVELRKDWAATGEPNLRFPTMLRCEINSIRQLVVLVDTGRDKWIYRFKQGPVPSSLVLDLHSTTASGYDVLAYATLIRAVQNRKVQSYRKLQSQINVLERYSCQAASFLDIATRDREMTAQEQTFATMLMAKLKPWVEQHTAANWDSILSPNRVQLQVLLKFLYKKYGVQRNPGLSFDH